ncbi:hypothetical protein SteCoe_30449 [Stentor coeruleus]|uniref:Alpha-1,3/1,6-mannosyltransferase ALG2 n=1 Tax=Stentor coeruleus TaxID=5963 RepID=A0A1R2B3I5_9CILI|nr:hypothetical protein SteCoe_30449 [Stentor coeruleus]
MSLKKNVAIIHPDLGIGGAEQLIVNIALALQMSGYEVTIFTPRHEKERSFKPTHDGTLNVQVKGSIFPSSIFGKCTALCSMIRMFLASLYVILFGGEYDFIIIDQVSAILPIFYLSSSKVIFYCHFPDQLLCTQRQSSIKRLYRFFIDKVEEIGLWKPDLIYVNSNFTLSITKSTFKSLASINLHILYPCIDLNFISNAPYPQFFENSKYFFSLNRYERKKNINLAIEAYSSLKDKSVKLLIGGGYDPKMQENVEHYAELCELCKKLELKYVEVDNWDKPIKNFDVYFVRNLSEIQREQALQNALGVLYTPENEHFGIVPVESMARGTPVIAINSGGPMESVKNELSGFLLDKDPKKWGEKMMMLSEDNEKRTKVGAYAKEWALKEFSLSSMSSKLNEDFQKLLKP